MKSAFTFDLKAPSLLTRAMVSPTLQHALGQHDVRSLPDPDLLLHLEDYAPALPVLADGLQLSLQELLGESDQHGQELRDSHSALAETGTMETCWRKSLTL